LSCPFRALNCLFTRSNGISAGALAINIARLPELLWKGERE
jgi:hypothetical protein